MFSKTCLQAAAASVGNFTKMPSMHMFTRSQEHVAQSVRSIEAWLSIPMPSIKLRFFYTTAKESSEKPSRLKTQLDKWSDAEAKKPKSLWDDAKAKHEAMELLKEEQRKSGERPPTPPVETAPAWDGVRTWCPHPSLLRGVCRLNKPRALDWGIDLTQAKGWDCPFWEAPRHRFEATASMPEARPVTPTRSLRWRAAEDWDNPDMHAPYKITHTIPKSNSMVELTRTRIS